jgi:hypothetical protein
VLANMSRCAEMERTKATVVRVELLPEFVASNLFVGGALTVQT